MSNPSSETEVVQVDIRDHVATVSLNRPDNLNACSNELLMQLRQVFDDLEDNNDVRCAILKGNGRAFCVGADMKERPGMTIEGVRRRRRLAPSCFGAMRRYSRPVIAQVHGYAIGSGLEIAMMCDLIVAAAGTVMGLPETSKASIPAAGGTQLLPRLIGVARAKELIYTSRKFTAEDALAWGLLNYVVPLDQLEQRVHDLAQEIAAVAPISIVQAKRAIDAGLDMDFDGGVRLEASLYERILNAKDRDEAGLAIREKRKPVYKGE